jgi:hypothetical protein
MNWDAIGALGQVFSALGLFLLIVQLRHARADMRRSVLDSMSNSLISSQIFAGDQRVLSATIKADGALGGARHPFIAALMESGLTEEEARLVDLRQRSSWHSIAQALRNVDSLKPTDVEALRANVVQNYGKSPTGRLWYQHAKNVVVNNEVKNLVDRALAEQ